MPAMVDGPDRNMPRSTPSEVLAGVREADALLRLMKAELANHEAVDDTRRVLMEHLLLEKRTLEADKSALSSPERAAAVQGEIEALEARLAEARAQPQPQELSDLDKRLTAARIRVARARSQQLQSEHSKALAELEARQRAVQRTIEENQARAEAHQRGLHDALEAERDRAAGLDDVLTRVREALADATSQRSAEERKLEERLIRASGELASQRDHNAVLDARVAEAEELCEQVRGKLREMAQLLTTSTVEAESAGEGASSTALSVCRRDTEFDIDIVDVDAHEPAVQVDNGLVDRLATAKSEVTLLGDEDVLADTTPETKSPTGPLNQAAFAGALVDGAHLITTPRFHQAQFVDKHDVMVSELLSQADTLEELRNLVPTNLRREVAHRIYRLYQHGYITLDR